MKQKFIFYISILALTLPALFQTGCVSLEESIDEKLREGRVDEALSEISSARIRSPASTEYAPLERRVRLHWISDKLIQVRLARLAGNRAVSDKMMREILLNETAWNLVPSGAAYSTQQEEATHLSESVQKEIYEALSAGRPLQAMSLYRRDRVLLEEILKIKTESITSAIASKGRDFCQSEAKVLTTYDHYSAKFLVRSCEIFQIKSSVKKTVNSVRLFKALTPELELPNVPPSQLTALRKDLEKEFEKSLWFDAEAKSALPVSISGKFSETISSEKEYRYKTYMVSEPYEVAVVKKKESNSNSGLGAIGLLADVFLWATTGKTPDKEVDNRDGTVTVYETHYRDVPHPFNYEVKEVTQLLAVDWKLELTPNANEKPHTFPFKDSLRTTSDEHSVSFAAAGVYPETRKVVPPGEWLLSLNQKLMRRLGEEFTVAWVDLFCSPLGSKSFGPLGERESFQRCLYGAGDKVPGPTAQWFTSRYGLTIYAWRELVDRRPTRMAGL